MDSSLGFFSGFNARHLDAEQVARAFVPGPKFSQLLGLQNSLLVGARGSGKTHMLKMLQPKDGTLGSIRKQRACGTAWMGIFVPADEAWRQQIESSATALPPDTQSTFRSAVFTTHVQQSVVDCFLQLTHDRPTLDCGFARVPFPITAESDLCRTIAASWQLTPRIHSLVGIRQAIVDRAADLYEAAERPAQIRNLLDQCQTQAIQAARRALSAFDSSAGRFEGRWCLMFDELEIAPSEIPASAIQKLAID